MEAWYHDDPATVTLTDMTLNTVYQGPHAGTAHAKLFTGTYTGTPDTVKARVTKETGGAEVTAWTALTPSGGNASGTASVAKAAAGDWYLAMLCAMNSQGIEIARSAGANRWAVGDQTVLVGNSNVTGTNSGTPYVSTNNNTVRRCNSGTTGRPANDPMMAETAGASPGPKCVDGLQTEIGGIVGLIGATRGLSPWRTVAGTWGGNTYTNSDCWSYRDAADLARTSWASCTTVYGKILFQIRNFIGNAAVGSLPSDFIPPKFWAWGGGEDDGGDGGMTTANWIAAVQSVRTNLISDGYMLSTSKITFSQMGKYTSGIGGVDAQFDKLRSAVLGLADNSTWFLTGSHIDKTRVDSVHIDLNAQETRQGPAMGRSLSFAAGIGARRHGPLISSYAFGADRTKIQVTIIHYGGTDFTPTSGITGFSVSDSGGVKTITGVVRLSATVIEITTSTACVGATAVQYLAGAEPTTTSLVLDNQASPMPMLASGVAVYVSEVGNGGDTNKSLYVGLGIRI
jgi:hypothetical protein